MSEFDKVTHCDSEVGELAQSVDLSCEAQLDWVPVLLATGDLQFRWSALENVTSEIAFHVGARWLR